jgi:hypothetical protein
MLWFSMKCSDVLLRNFDWSIRQSDKHFFIEIKISSYRRFLMVSGRLKTEQIGKCNSSPILIFAVGTELLESILNKNIAKQTIS